MYTIVVADDEEELRRALIRKVDWESIGFSVVGEAENGVEALELVEKYEPDLLLTDIRMPFLSGIELARQVREVRPATQIAFLSGFDDFSYAQQAIQYNIVSYMLKPISASELTEELIKIRKKIDEKFQQFTSPAEVNEKGEILGFLMPLLLDSYWVQESSEQKLLDEAAAYGLIKSKKNKITYTVMVVSIVDNEGNNKTSRTTVQAVELILQKYVKHISFYAEGRVITFVQASAAQLDKYLHIIVEEISQSVKRIMDCNAKIGVSRITDKLSGAHDAYVEAMNVIRYSKRNGITTHFIADVERGEGFDIKKIQLSVEDVEKYIRNGSREELNAYLDEMFDRMEQEEMPYNMINFALSHMLTVVMRIVYAVAGEMAAGEIQKNVPLFGQKESMAVMRTRYIAFCLSVRDLIAEQRKKSSTLLCDKALKIIEQNYMNQDLSLGYVSNEIAVSPNYLSALIKKSTGSTFVDLLTQKRMEVAKELLMCTDMKIREIAEKCGYSDQHYFSYCFKKYTGMSPNACRGK